MCGNAAYQNLAPTIPRDQEGVSIVFLDGISKG